MDEKIELTEEQIEELKKIVLARIRVMPNDVSVSIGGEDMPKKDLLDHVENGDEIGKHLMLTELEYLQDMASGAIYSNG